MSTGRAVRGDRPVDSRIARGEAGRVRQRSALEVEEVLDDLRPGAGSRHPASRWPPAWPTGNASSPLVDTVDSGILDERGGL